MDIYINLNSHFDAPNTSWYDYQREYFYIIESLEKDIMGEIIVNLYWRSIPSVGHIFEDILKKIKRKIWIGLKTEYLYDLPKQLGNLIPFSSQSISPLPFKSNTHLFLTPKI
jgi:hypothetical protein